MVRTAEEEGGESEINSITTHFHQRLAALPFPQQSNLATEYRIR